MKALSEILAGPGPTRVVLTDSGLGGLSICAQLENRLRQAAGRRAVRLIYVNAWPSETGGYNDMPDIETQAGVLDKTLVAMAAFRPHLILIACNTLSVLYEMTDSRRAAPVPAAGIIDAGVDLFEEALRRDPEGLLALFGTRTTIESGEHVRRLTRRGVEARRIIPAACPGLAGAIDKDPGGPGLASMVEECLDRAFGLQSLERSLYAGLACTHYSYIAGLFQSALGRRTRGRVEVLDPKDRLVRNLTSNLETAAETAETDIGVEVVSKVELAEAQRAAMGRRLEPVSFRTAQALLHYRHLPELF